MEYVIQILTAFAGSIGFALLFNVRGRKIIPAGFGGIISWSVYLIFAYFGYNDFIGFMMGSCAITFYSDAMARIQKAPATIYLVSATIPLIPGGSLYTTMHYAMMQQWMDFSRQGLYTLTLAAGIALGIICTMSVMKAGRMAIRFCLRKAGLARR